jgi:hypothetical protein
MLLEADETGMFIVSFGAAYGYICFTFHIVKLIHTLFFKKTKKELDPEPESDPESESDLDEVSDSSESSDPGESGDLDYVPKSTLKIKLRKRKRT